MAPKLTLSDSARVALSMLMQRHSKYVPVATVTWSEGGWTEYHDQFGNLVHRTDGPGWDVGFYDRSRVPEDQIVTLGGIEFVFDQGPISMRLDGRQLDYRNGGFIVDDGAA